MIDPDRLLANRAADLLEGILESPHEFNCHQVASLVNQAQSDNAAFARLFLEWDYSLAKRRPWEPLDGNDWAIASLRLQWERTDWAVVASAIAPLIPHFQKKFTHHNSEVAT